MTGALVQLSSQVCGSMSELAAMLADAICASLPGDVQSGIAIPLARSFPCCFSLTLSIARCILIWHHYQFLAVFSIPCHPLNTRC